MHLPCSSEASIIFAQGVDKSAMMNLACLDNVTKNNIVFFKYTDASQNNANFGSFCLLTIQKCYRIYVKTIKIWK